MAGETKHGGPNPPGQNRAGQGPGMECTEFEALLSEAIDGQLSGATLERFEAHRQACGVCGPLFADAQAGQQWLRSMEEVEVPANLVHNILAATSGIESAQAAAPLLRGVPLSARLREWWDSFFTPVGAFVRQPRFVMSFGMIFFSFSALLNLAGVKPADLAKVDVRPSALKHAYYNTQGRVVKFYDNIRFVYEIESRVREFKRETRPAEPGPEEPKQNHKNNTSGQPDEKQQRNYSREENQPVLASYELRSPSSDLKPANCALRTATDDSRAISEYLLSRSSKLVAPSCLPDVTLTTNRRFV